LCFRPPSRLFNLKKLLFIFSISVAPYSNVIAQNPDINPSDSLISADLGNTKIEEVIQYLEATYHLRFFYKKEWLKVKAIDSFKVNNASLDDALNKLFNKKTLLIL
jgi:hypothetical protein